MADETTAPSTEESQVPPGYFNQFKTGNNNPVTVDDVQNYNYGLTQDQESAYKQEQEKYTPVKPVLNTNDYYPNQGDPIGVGQFSGSWRNGSINATQYAPNGAIVPIGMWDARDAAIQKAAMMKAKDVDDWKKRNAQAPTSKLTNINDNIREEFFKHQDDSWKKALKANGGDANKAKYALENDPNYQAKNKAFYDQAKMGDAVVAHDAQLEDDVRSGKKIMTPDMIEARKKLHSSLDPSSNDFKDFANHYNSYVAVNEFNEAYNTVVDKMTKEKLAHAGISDSDPRYWSEYKNTREFMRDDQKQAIEDSLNQMYKGHGDNFYTPEHVHKQVWGRNSNVREEKDVNLQHKPDDKGEGDTYDANSSVIAQSEENAGEGEDIHSTVSEHYVPAGAKDQTKKIKVALSNQDYSATTDQHVNASGNVEGTVQGWATKLYDKEHKRYLNPKEAETIQKMMSEGKARQSHNYEWKPVAIFNVIPKKGEGADESTPQETIFMDADKFAGVYKSKNKKTEGHDFDEMREKTVEYAKQKNESVKNSSSQKQSSGSGTFYKIKGKEHPHSAVEKAAKASGMTVDEYLIEVNK